MLGQEGPADPDHGCGPDKGDAHIMVMQLNTSPNTSPNISLATTLNTTLNKTLTTNPKRRPKILYRFLL
jgi:hypothetical protein